MMNLGRIYYPLWASVTHCKMRRGASDAQVPIQHGILGISGVFDFRQCLRIKLLGLNSGLGAEWPWAGSPSCVVLRFSICKVERRLTPIAARTER